MREDKDFISWTYDPTINRDRADMIVDMVRFIREGLRDQGGPPKEMANINEMDSWVKAALFERLQSPMANPIPKRMLAPAGDTLEMVATVIKEESEWVIKKAPLAAFRCGKITEELQQRLNSFWHPEINEEEPTVATAFEVAFSNVARASTRLVLMHAIVRLLKLSAPPLVWGKVREELWFRKVGFDRDLLLFGALHGGELLKTATRLVAGQTCYNHDPESHVRYGLIHYLQRDGYTPGRWWSKTEENLDNDIRAKYEAL